MKINNFVKKSGLVLAISAMSAGAMAGVHGYGNPVVLGADGSITLANEVFGTGSEETLIAIPENNFEVDVAKNAVAANDVVTVKYTLDRGAVFGEDLSDIQKWADSNAVLVFNTDAVTEAVGGAGAGYTPAGEFASIAVDAGGAIGDNTVTFRIEFAGAATSTTFDDIQIGQFRVKNLTSALERGVANPVVRLGAEFRNVTQNETDTQAALPILRSQNGVELDGVLTDYDDTNGNGDRARIDVADSELSFTGADFATDSNVGSAAGQDFDETDNADFVKLGTLQVVRTQDGNGDVVRKENGGDFDFQGSDQPVVTIASTADLAAYSSIYLNAPGDECGTGTPVASVVPAAGSTSADISLAGQSTVDLEAGYNVCATAGGTVRIPESTFSAELNVTYFNPRYTDSQDTLSYGPVLRNGCQVTLFNLPHAGAPDNAFIRLTNVSELSGAVRAFIWTEDGQQIDVNSELVNNLAGHATTVLHTNSDLAAGVFLGDVMPTYGATTSGRHRLVVQGAFPACEALGLIRSPNGTLTNMTSTTYSGDDSRLGTEQSNTSNTSN